jgi:uncharacterized protein (TIGR02301 family)
MIPRIALAVSLLLSVLAQSSTAAQSKSDAPPPAPPVDAGTPAPYDDQLLRLSEILGSVHYLRHLCAPGAQEDWREKMQQLLDTETRTEPTRKERLTAAFNRGYRSFASVYTDCTPQAISAEERYRNEGATLATEITARFGN